MDIIITAMTAITQARGQIGADGMLSPMPMFFHQQLY